MNLKKVITPETISLDLQSATKEDLILEMLNILMAAGKIKDIKDRDEALKAILARESKMSTGMQNGIAIPHGKSDVVPALIAALGVKKQGIDFGALDGKPSHIFIMTLSPDNRTGPHIQFLAEVSRQLNDPAIRERILTAQSKDVILDCLSE